MIAVWTGLLPFLPMTIVLVMVMWERSHLLGKNNMGSTDKRNFKKRMDRSTDYRVVTEIMFRKAYYSIRSINQSVNKASVSEEYLSGIGLP